MHTMWIVSGPTSVGKSTFMRSAVCAGITGLPPETSIMFAWQCMEGIVQTQGSFYLHYNVLRPLPFQLASNGTHGKTPQLLPGVLRRFLDRSFTRHGTPDERTGVCFAADPAWRNILLQRQQKKTIVLVTGHEELLRRVEVRASVESTSPGGQPMQEYDSSYWLDIYRRIDLVEVYLEWCRELERHDIEYSLIDSTNLAYGPIESVARLVAIVSSSRS